MIYYQLNQQQTHIKKAFFQIQAFKLPWQLIVLLSATIYLTWMVWLEDSLCFKMVRNGFKSTWYSILETLVGCFLFWGLITLVSTVAIAMIKWTKQSHSRLFPTLYIAFMLLMLLNSIPIFFYIQWFRNVSDYVWIARTLPLVMANGMLYYFLYTFVLELFEESKKLYVISAPFKGKKALNSLFEHAQWIVIGNIRPVFYYLFSFTLFTDFFMESLLKQIRGFSGIMGLLFGTAMREGFSLKFQVYFLSMFIMIFPLMQIIDYFKNKWESTRKMSNKF